MRKLDPGNGNVCVCHTVERGSQSPPSISNPLSPTHSASLCAHLGKSWDRISETATYLLCWLQNRACYRVLIVMDSQPETGYWARLLVAGPPVHSHVRKMFSWLPFPASLTSHGLLSGGLQPIIGASRSSLSQIHLPTLSTQFQFWLSIKVVI